MSERADEVINQEAEWQEVEDKQEQSREVEEAAEQDEPEAEGDEQEGEESEGGEQDADDEISLFLGDEELVSPSSEEVKQDSDLVKKLRKEIQERNRELHELRAKQQAQPAPIDEPLTIPTLESADWDEEVYQQKLAAYYEQKSAQEKAKQEQEKQQTEFMQLHNQKLAQYHENASKLGVKGFERAEKVVLAEVPESIQGAILHYADKPEIVVLAAGLNPAIRKQLAETTDPVALGKLIGSIEAKAKLLPKSKQNKPAPSAQVKGSQGAGKQSAVDADFNKAFPDAVIR
ncbi:MAG: hypothetical protein ACRDBH_08645 [Bosea sp. (in: a-proteobacteria)]